ncbi:hypothetical protein SDC9_125181 [bioreactor metagenome]|uniref:Uncharacterized protein n=1 Tax=bioreactor metagenome TaxID=1076179 RepID=A0A645CM86_9ZZZZ
MLAGDFHHVGHIDKINGLIVRCYCDITLKLPPERFHGFSDIGFPKATGNIPSGDLFQACRCGEALCQYERKAGVAFPKNKGSPLTKGKLPPLARDLFDTDH